MHNHFLLRISSIFILSVFAMSASADNAWSSYHWARMANPFTLLVVDSVTSDWDMELDIALGEWSASGVLDLVIFPEDEDDAKKTRRRCRMVNGQIRVCNDSYGFNGWLGMATIGIDSGGHIDRGTAKVNDSYSSYWEEGWKNHIMCQEIGHLFGLGHTSTDGSGQGTCMDYSWYLASQWPNVHDYDQLRLIYGHNDNYNSYDGVTVDEDGGGGSGCNAPPGKGCNKKGAGSAAVVDIPPMGIRVSQNPNAEVWVAPRSDGGLWIHHILLVPEN